MKGLVCEISHSFSSLCKCKRGSKCSTFGRSFHPHLDNRTHRQCPLSTQTKRLDPFAPHCDFAWKVYIWTGGERSSMDDEDVERVPTRSTSSSSMVANFPLLHGSHRSFSLCQSSIFSCRSSRRAVAQRSTFEQNGVGRIYSFPSQVMARMGCAG